MRRRWGRPQIGSFKWAARSRGWGSRVGPGARFRARPKGWRPARSAAAAPPAARGWAPKRRKRFKRRYLLLAILLLLLFGAIQTAFFFDRHLREPLLFLAKIRITQIAAEAINTAIAERFAEQADAEKLIQWKTNETGKITGFLIDYQQHLKITAETTRVVENVLREKEEIPEHIPLGHALNSPLLSSIGPSVSVKFQPAGAVKVDVDTRETNAGINNILVEVFIRVRIDVAIVIPFDREPETIETEIPISYLLVVGDVPMFYYDNKGNPLGGGAGQAPPIALPSLPSRDDAAGH